MPTLPYRTITDDRKYNEILLLDESYEQADTPRGFIDIELFPHQKTVLAALIRLEDRPLMMITDAPVNTLTRDRVRLQSSAIVLSEAFGSGKTFEILGLILARPIPRAFPQHANAVLLGAEGKYSRPSTFLSELVARYTGDDVMIRSTIIIVSRSVLIQWEETIRRYTSLKVLVVGDIAQLRIMKRLYDSRQLNRFDIILVKNGNVTGEFVMDGVDAAAAAEDGVRSLIGVISRMTATNCFARVVIDDFDTSAMPPNAVAINSLSTLYVSATTKSNRRSRKIVPVRSFAQLLHENQRRYSDALWDKSLFSNFNVRNTADYVETSTRVPIVISRKCVYDNPNDRYMAMMGVMGTDDALEVMEMLNGDAIEEAAARMNVKTTNVADIFQRILANKYERFVRDRRMLESVTAARAAEKLLPIGMFDHTVKEIDAQIARLRKGGALNTEFTSLPLRLELERVFAESTESAEDSSRAITNVLENLREGGCQICLNPFDDVGVFINKCCGVVICDECGIIGNKVAAQYDYKSKQQTLVGSCCSCKVQIYPHKDLIYVSAEFDIESLLDSKKFEEGVAETIAAAAPPAAAAAEPDEKQEELSPKLTALLAILRGQDPENVTEFEHSIKHLLIGKHDMGFAAKKKILVFANFSESITAIERFLIDNDVEYLRLGGTAAQISATVEQFRTYGEVLLVNSSRHCAGINLQFATDMVFFHKIIDENIESQVAGRCIRIGRTSNLTMWWLFYKNEERIVARQR